MSCDSHSCMPNGRIIRCNGDHYAREPHRAILGSEDFPEPVYWHDNEGESDANAEDSAGSWSNAPAHYQGEDGIQPWDIIRAFGLNFWAGNVCKYLLRYQRKGDPLGDLRKARHYLDYLIEQEEGKDE